MSFHGQALDHRFSVDAEDPALADFVRRALRHLEVGATAAGGTADRFVLEWLGPDELEVRRNEHVLFNGEPTPALAHLMSAINVSGTRSVDDGIVLHCGVAALDGRAILLPGRPGAGKSTTLTALLLRGLGYLSDETGPIGADGRIRPYPKPLVVGPGSWPSVPEAADALVELEGRPMDAWWLDPGAFPGGVVTEPLPVGAIVAPQYREGSPLQVERLSRAEATTAMASNTFNIAEHGRSGIEAIAALTEGATLLRVTFGDVAEACDAVLAEIEA